MGGIFFPISNLNLTWCNLGPFSPILLLPGRRDWPPPHYSSFQVIVEVIRFPLSLLSSRINTPSSLSHSSPDSCSRPFPIFVAFLWMRNAKGYWLTTIYNRGKHLPEGKGQLLLLWLHQISYSKSCTAQGTSLQIKRERNGNIFIHFCYFFWSHTWKTFFGT